LFSNSVKFKIVESGGVLILLKILVVIPSIADRIREYLPEDIQILKPVEGSDDELITLARDVEVILASRLSPEVVEAAPKLRLLQKTGAGVDDLPIEALGKDVFIANTSGTNPVPLAEGAVALVLALAKQIVPKHQLFRKKRLMNGVLLQGKKAGIIGYGSIGREVGKRLQAFGMEILGIKRTHDETMRQDMGLEFLGTPEDLPCVLKESDFVIITAPLTPETRGMIGEEELKLMKLTACIINVARASLIQEEPLYRALHKGVIAGAAIDVWWTPHFWDPLWNPEGKDAAEHPFWDLDNIICTTHNLAVSDSRSDSGIKIMAENILRIRAGKPPINQVDKEFRY
jgi:D-3-phosphoglycerate dehydrogenase